MDKDETLTKSKQIHRDNGTENTERQGRRIGFAACAVLFMFLMTFTFFYGELSALYSITSMTWAFLAAESYEKYRYTKTKVNFINVILFSIASLISTVNYVLMTLK